MRERGFVVQSMRVVAGGDQQDRGGVDADAVDVEQAWARRARRSEYIVERRLSASSARTRRPRVAIASFVAYMTLSLPPVGRNAAAVGASWSRARPAAVRAARRER